MEYTGLVRKYAVNRPLTSSERDRQLRQKQKHEAGLAYQLSVIRISSTFLELVDKYYAWKGVLTSVVLAAFVILLGMVGAMTAFAAITPGRLETDWSFLLSMYGLVAAPLAFGVWLLKKEAFAYTHYPLRFNRKTRKVHVFRFDGTALTVPWDKIFFCLAPVPQRLWEIQGHVLADDRQTVVHTFALPAVAGGTKADRQVLLGYWEFVRRYMEDGPNEAYALVKVCLPIASEREPVMFGFHRMHAEAGRNAVLGMLMGLIAVALLPGRWIAMRTSKLPMWPPHVEETCRIEPGDAYVRDASTNS